MPKGQYLGEFELYVLSALARLGADAYGMTVRREIEERAGRSVAIGAVYATLDRLAEKGLVSFTISDPLPVPGGRAALVLAPGAGVDGAAPRHARAPRAART
jgi:hypothetical protein